MGAKYSSEADAQSLSRPRRCWMLDGLGKGQNRLNRNTFFPVAKTRVKKKVLALKKPGSIIGHL